VPLGGNRKGPGRTYVNLMLTMLIGGLWHGAAWTFVVWGGLHGAYLVIERFLRQRIGHWPLWDALASRIGLALLTYALVNITWVFFRAQDFDTAWRVLSAMLWITPEGTPVLNGWLVGSGLLTVAGLVAVHGWMRERELHAEVQRLPSWLVGVLWGGMAFLIAITQGGSDAFIYFQF
jgi:alginate O-acetyltransferase complex protein AlgI